MSSFDPFKYNVCAFCMNPTKEKFFSGSYETYETCECSAYEVWQKQREILLKIEARAIAKQEFMYERNSINKLRKELARRRERLERLATKADEIIKPDGSLSFNSKESS